MWHARKIFSFAWTYLRRYSGRLVLGIFCGLLFAASNGAFVWLTRAFTDRAADDTPEITTAAVSPTGTGITNAPPLSGPVESKKNPSWLAQKTQAANSSLKSSLKQWFPESGTPVTGRHVVALLVFLPLFAFVRGALDYLSNYCMGWVSERAMRDLRMDVMEKLSLLSLDYFTRSNTGDLLTRINSDTHTLLRAARSAAPDLIKESFTVVVVFAGLCLMDWKLTVVAMVILPLCIVPVVVLGLRARKAARAGRHVNTVQMSQLVELINGIRVIKSFNRERAEVNRFREKSSELVRAGMKGVQAKESMGPMIEIATAFCLGIMLLFIFWTERRLTDLPAFVVGFLLFFQALRKLAAVHFVFEQAHTSVEHLIEIMAEEPKVSDPVNPKPLREFKSGIQLENVRFSYGAKPLLDGVNLSIPQGFRLGIAGGSGCGKTTLVNLLFRFYDVTGGSIKIDGLDLREISLHDLRQQLALVSQEIVVFDQTIAQNIAIGKPDATRAEIEAAARAAFAHDFIMQQPNGYDTMPGERGATLSVGQRQRICIARAFVRNAPILVLDEATASLDSQAELEVQAAIDRLAEHRTVVCIAHRLSTLSSMDQIIVLKEGRIIEQGSFQELLERGGAFATMAAPQGIFPARSVSRS